MYLFSFRVFRSSQEKGANMKWVNLRVDNQEDRLRIAAALCESGYQVYCRFVKHPSSLSSEHYVCVMLDAGEVTEVDAEE